MLFMNIFKWEPDKRDEVRKRREDGILAPAGVKCLGQWTDAQGGRSITLFDCNDSMALIQWARVWSDLGKSDVFPVVDTEELYKAMASQ